MGHLHWNSRMQTSPSTHSTVEPSKIFILPLRVSQHAHNMCHHVACTVQNILYYMHQVLDHLTYSLDLPSCDFHASGSLEKVSKGCTFMSDKDVKTAKVECFQKQLRKLFVGGGSTGWCKNGMPVSVSMYQFSMVTIPSPRTICELVSSKKASYIHTGHHLEYNSILNLLNWEVWLMHTLLPSFFLYRCNNLKPCSLHRNYATKTNNITPTDNSKYSISRFIKLIHIMSYLKAKRIFLFPFLFIN